MSLPVRLRLSRKKGFDLQAHSLGVNGLMAVNVARPGPWGNPFVVGVDGTREHCVSLFSRLLSGDVPLTASRPAPELMQIRESTLDRIPDLVGKNLACWCPSDGMRCHADLLLDFANPRARQKVKP